MCGIAGFRLGRENERQVASQLQSRLASRGPDGRWFQKFDGWGLVQTRLAVIDLSPSVVYPMPNETGDLRLLFNGEIYRHEPLRADLQKRGHTFRTMCDAEVVVHAYEEWGHDAFARLDGMFAVALVDAKRHQLVLTRDALGIKPLVCTVGRGFAFASDTMALVASGLSAGQPDREAARALLVLGYVPAPATGVQDVCQLEPGATLTVDRQGGRRNLRWRPRPFTTAGGPMVRLEEVRDALDRSVAAQLVADVPVGVFLSSGIDSCLVLDSAVRAGAAPTAFTVGFAGHGDFDERERAARFARSLGVPHVWRDLNVSFDEALLSVANAFDVPFGDASAIATVALAQMAREEVTVALSGTGGDDLFAGYYRHRAHLLWPLVGRLPKSLRAFLARAGGQVGAERRSALSVWRSYASRLGGGSCPDPWMQYLSLVSSHASARALGLIGAEPGPPTEWAGLDAQPNGESLLRHIQALELSTYLPGDLLAKEDRATMAVGLEARVPMLASELVSLAERASDSDKISLRSGKRPLRELAKERLPRFLNGDRKRGFAVPLAAYLAGGWREPAIEWLSGAGSTIVECADASTLFSCGELNAVEMWTLCVLTAWEQRLQRDRVSAEPVRI